MDKASKIMMNINNNNNTNNNNEVISFYIPRIKKCYTEEHIKNIFQDMNIGLVKRVDFVPIEFMAHELDSQIQSAFIHMINIVNIMYEIGFQIYQQVVVLERPYKLYLYPKFDNYWLILKNKNPIHETNLNIHQVVENARLLQEKVIKQEETINNLIERLTRLNSTILHRILPRIPTTNSAQDIRWLNHTTHLLLGEDDVDIIEKGYGSDLNDYDSMPSLIDMEDEDEYDTPKSTKSYERIRNTVDLCGNN